MKGVIFTEFMELVEQQFSEEVAEQIIELADPASGGSYTSLGTYDHSEILALVTHLSQITGADAGDLQLAFGEFLFGRFSIIHGNFMVGVPDRWIFYRRFRITFISKLKSSIQSPFLQNLIASELVTGKCTCITVPIVHLPWWLMV